MKSKLLFVLPLILAPLPGIGAETIWAVNLGGPEYLGADGTHYAAEESVVGGRIGYRYLVKGTQDPTLYRSYRYGEFRLEHPVANGAYDLTLLFSEPDQLATGARVFNVFAEDTLIAERLDIVRARDGRANSALTITLPGVTVADGQLDIGFEPIAGQPVLNGVLLHRRAQQPWHLVWADEFDGDELDATSWNVETWPARVVNDEDQVYTARVKNLRLEEGHLVIEAHRESLQNGRYTSARIQTHGKRELLYGRIEVRARLPRGKGTWPAIWMLPSDPFRYATTCTSASAWQGNVNCDAWPNSGEIDIMEHVGYEMNHIHGTVHTRAYYWANWQQRKGRLLLDDAADAFHVYAMEWDAARIRIFVDDGLYFTYVNEDEGWQSWPFDQPFHLILNLAVGGMWGRAGGGIDDSIFPQRFLIDYVRFYQRAAPASPPEAPDD